MSVVSWQAADGRRCAVGFTGLDSLAAWHPEARPVPVTMDVLAKAALDDHAVALIIDVAGPASLVAGGRAAERAGQWSTAGRPVRRRFRLAVGLVRALAARRYRPGPGPAGHLDRPDLVDDPWCYSVSDASSRTVSLARRAGEQRGLVRAGPGGGDHLGQGPSVRTESTHRGERASRSRGRPPRYLVQGGEVVPREGVAEEAPATGRWRTPGAAGYG